MTPLGSFFNMIIRRTHSTALFRSAILNASWTTIGNFVKLSQISH